MSLGKSKKKMGKGGPVLEKFEIPVETDANKLVKFVCGSNILKEGQDVELKPDSEYPDWLWKLNIGNALSYISMRFFFFIFYIIKTILIQEKSYPVKCQTY
jgi:large subunit ribosomal protein L54